MAIIDKFSGLMAAHTDDELYKAIDKMTENEKKVFIYSATKLIKSSMAGGGFMNELNMKAFKGTMIEAMVGTDPTIRENTRRRALAEEAAASTGGKIGEYDGYVMPPFPNDATEDELEEMRRKAKEYHEHLMEKLGKGG